MKPILYDTYKSFQLSGGGYTNRRESADKDKLMELADSILERGLDVPLTAWITKESDKEIKVIISGSRRYTAIGMLLKDGVAGDLAGEGKGAIPYYEFFGTLWEARLEAFSLNLHREDLTAFETAGEIFELVESGMDQKDIAEKLCKSQPWVSILYNSYKRSCTPLKKAWQAESLPLDQVYNISSIEDEDEQATATRDALAARAAGTRPAAAEGRRRVKEATGKNDYPTRKQVAEYLALAEGCPTKNKYVAGMRDFAKFVMGEIGVGEFDKPWFDWMETRGDVAEEVDGQE